MGIRSSQNFVHHVMVQTGQILILKENQQGNSQERKLMNLPTR